MAIETDVGSGGLGQMPQLTQDPMMQEAPMMTDGLQAENVFEFDDGSHRCCGRAERSSG